MRRFGGQPEDESECKGVGGDENYVELNGYTLATGRNLNALDVVGAECVYYRQ
jgi:hypothetical protein